MARKTILIIDTNKELMQRMISTLESADYLVFTVSSRHDSIHMAKSVNPSLIFINIGMSGVSALEISKTIHDDETLKDIPIVIITPHGGTVEPRYTSLYGIVDFLKATFSPEEFISKTQEIISMTTAHEELIEEGMKQQEIEVPIFEEKKSEVQPIDKSATAQPIEEKIEAQCTEKQIETGEAEKPETAAEKISDIMTEDIEKDEQTIRKQNEEIFRDSALPSEDLETAYIQEKIKSSIKKTKPLIPILILMLIIISTAGIVLYKFFWNQTKIQRPVMVKPSIPVQQQAAGIQPSQELQKPQPIEIVKPTSSPASLPSPKVKPAVKSVYAVQIGVYKNKKNAQSILKKYKEKAYNCYIYNSTTKGKGILYRVLIGNFHNKKEVAKLADTIRTKENINAIVFHQ